MSPQFDLVGIVTRDLVRSLAFYRELGLDVPDNAGAAPHIEVTLPNGLRLAWDTLETIHSFDPEFDITNGGHPISLAFKFDTPAEVDEAYQRLTTNNDAGHKAPWDAVWGQRYAIVHDPDGNTVDLFANKD